MCVYTFYLNQKTAIYLNFLSVFKARKLSVGLIDYSNTRAKRLHWDSKPGEITAITA